MKLKKNLSLLLILLLSSIITSCASIPDVPICKEINPDKGWCSYTLTKGGFYVDEERPYAFDPKDLDENGEPKKSTWWEIRPVMMQMPPHSWAEFKKYIIKQCRLTKKCEANVGEWFNKMESKKDESCWGKFCSNEDGRKGVNL